MHTICEKAEGRKVRAAVAYAGDGATDLLPVKAGDLIVVNGSRNAIASGATSARLLRSWYEQGVLLYAHETLHAKVFVIGRTAFVGSANLSLRAHTDRTVEAAIQSTDAAVVVSAREFIDEMAANAIEIDEAWLDWAATVPVRTAGGPVLWNPDPPFEPNEPYDVWTGPEVSADWTDEEIALAQAGYRMHKVAGGRGRYGTIAISESATDASSLVQPDMVLLIRPRSVQLVRFLDRRRRGGAAMGFYRTDRDCVRRTLGEVAAALDSSPAKLREGDWARMDSSQREALRELFKLPKLPARS
ncbi:phospholipase D-like domain-containing protein [Micromonospora sp. NPDC049301]|uniref:phospholipase D-like domain-containing protein n=1 Tax=Micromonospora sp. NPDC049301 TaxID=3155723 RepID=UPI00344082BD